MNKNKYGTYSISLERLFNGKIYLYIKEDGIIKITRTELPSTSTKLEVITDKEVLDYYQNVLLDSAVSISYLDFIEQYRYVLGQADDILGTRGTLIKPEEVNEKLYVDDNMIIKLL